MTLWGWFLVPLGVPAITFWHASGLGALLGVFLGPRGISRTSEGPRTMDSEITYHLCCAVLIPLFSLLSGWVAHHNM